MAVRHTATCHFQVGPTKDDYITVGFTADTPEEAMAQAEAFVDGTKKAEFVSISEEN